MTCPRCGQEWEGTAHMCKVDSTNRLGPYTVTVRPEVWDFVAKAIGDAEITRLRAALATAEAHACNHHLEACESCAVTESDLIAAKARVKELEEALEPFLIGSGDGRWGKILAWVVYGAPIREDGIREAKYIVHIRKAATDAARAVLAKGAKGEEP